MFKKSTLLAALIVATVCGGAPKAQAGWIAYWAVKRWHNHYAGQAHNVGWDYASTIGNGGWGSHPKHWARAIVHSARPWPPALDHYLGGGRMGGAHFGGWGQQGLRRGHHGHRHHADCGCDECGHGRHAGRHSAGWGHAGGHAWMGGQHGGYGYGYEDGDSHGEYPSYGHGEGPLSDAVYDDANGVIHDGGMTYEGAPGAAIPGAQGPAFPYDPKVAPKKEGELVDPPSKPMKIDPAPKKEEPAPATKKTAAHAATKLVLNVPVEAKVTLAGVDTKSHGAQREFVTTLLGDSSWTDYQVRVEFEHNGRMQVAERSITLNAGDHHELTIDFTPSQVASK